MRSAAIFLLAAVLTAAATPDYHDLLKDSNWNELLARLMKSDFTTKTQTLDSGKCGEFCYISGVDRLFEQSDTYVNPDDPCNPYTCEGDEVTQTKVECSEIASCPDMRAPVIYPGQCCATCAIRQVEDKFSEWGPWTACTTTCGGGARARRRRCLLSEGGVFVECSGETQQIEECPMILNANLKDQDGDNVVDVCDNCPLKINPLQENADGDETGDACDPDDDNDTELDPSDNCPRVWNVDETDTDGDGLGDACDSCPDKTNYNNKLGVNSIENKKKQLDSDGDGVGDVCDDQPNVKNDKDGDGIYDGFDNCPDKANPGQEDKDYDRVGDVCDNCPSTFNPTQADYDGDEVGNTCDICYIPNDPKEDSDNDCIPDACDYGGVADKDGDGIADKCDNCPDDPNEDQLDSDGDGWGDVCDTCKYKFLPGTYMSRCKNNDDSAESANASTHDRKGVAAEIMEKLLEMYYSN